MACEGGALSKTLTKSLTAQASLLGTLGLFGKCLHFFFCHGGIKASATETLSGSGSEPFVTAEVATLCLRHPLTETTRTSSNTLRHSFALATKSSGLGSTFAIIAEATAKTLSLRHALAITAKTTSKTLSLRHTFAITTIHHGTTHTQATALAHAFETLAHAFRTLFKLCQLFGR